MLLLICVYIFFSSKSIVGSDWSSLNFDPISDKFFFSSLFPLSFSTHTILISHWCQYSLSCLLFLDLFFFGRKVSQRPNYSFINWTIYFEIDPFFSHFLFTFLFFFFFSFGFSPFSLSSLVRVCVFVCCSTVLYFWSLWLLVSMMIILTLIYWKLCITMMSVDQATSLAKIFFFE